MTANYFRGRLREGAGDAEGALAAYETALAADRSDIEILLRAARLYVVLEKDNSALHALLRATVYTPDSYDAHFALGFLYYLRGNYERALASLWRARELAGEFSVDMSRLIACVYQKAQKAEIRTALDEEEGENPWACHDLLVERLSTLEEVDKIDMGYAGLDDERRLLVFELGVSADSMSGK